MAAGTGRLDDGGRGRGLNHQKLASKYTIGFVEVEGTGVPGAPRDLYSRDFSPGSCRFFIYFRPAKTTKFYGANQVSSSHPCLE